MDEFRNTPDFNEEDDLIELVDENGETTVFEHLATLEYEGEKLLQINEELVKFDSLVDPNWTDMEKAKFIYDYLSNDNKHHVLISPS